MNQCSQPMMMWKTWSQMPLHRIWSLCSRLPRRWHQPPQQTLHELPTLPPGTDRSHMRTIQSGCDIAGREEAEVPAGGQQPMMARRRQDRPLHGNFNSRFLVLDILISSSVSALPVVLPYLVVPLIRSLPNSGLYSCTVIRIAYCVRATGTSLCPCTRPQGRSEPCPAGIGQGGRYASPGTAYQHRSG